MVAGVKEIRKKILQKDKPFSLTDLFMDLGATDSNDRRLIIQVLNDMYAEGIIVYDKFSDTVSEPTSTHYAFRVA